MDSLSTGHRVAVHRIRRIKLPMFLLAKSMLLSILLLTPRGSLAQNGPVAHYSFENGFADSSGHGITGSPLGDAAIVYDGGRRSNVLRLDGSDACVDLGNNALFNWSGSFSAAFWVKVNRWHGAWDTILKKTNAWALQRQNDQQVAAFVTWPNYLPTAAPLDADGDWHHVAATYDGVSQKIYLDGTLSVAAANAGAIAVNTNHLFIGAADGTARFFDGWLDDLRIYGRALTAAEIDTLSDFNSHRRDYVGPVTEVDGNFELNVEIKAGSMRGPVRVFFSAALDTSTYAFAEVQDNLLRIGRKKAGVTKVWKTAAGSGTLPLKLRILKKGNFYRFWANGATAWIRGPMGEWEGIYEPRRALAGVITPDSGMVRSFSVTSLPWLNQITQPLIPRGPAGSYYEAQVIPGAFLKHKDRYYIYFMAGMTGNQEGAFGRKIGVAWSTDLRTWTVQPEPILSYEQLGDAGDNLYPSGAVVTPDGKIAIMYAVQKFPAWKGFYLATADNPLGPFQNSPKNPVYTFKNTAHEFDLLRVDRPEYRYVLIFAGFTENPPSGPVGDRGYVIYSDDLLTWRDDPRNPVFSPSTLNDWDAVHIRPRSLNLLGDTFYLWYEGANTWKSPNPNWVEWWDTVGLARSKDLVNWEYYPRNPALPGLGHNANQWDKNWTGWPRMFVENDTGYVFYTGDGVTGMRPIPIGQLTNWLSEGGAETAVGDEMENQSHQESASAREFTLYKNYPNPFNSSTTVRFTLARASQVEIMVYNMLGEQVRRLVDTYLAAGTHTVVYDAGSIPAGVYFCVMRAQDFMTTNKFLVLK